MGWTAAAALVVSTYSAVEQQKSQKEARAAQQKQFDEETKARQEQQARNEAQAAQERRNQIREERVRRARVLQASQNTGTVGSSGEAGATGSLSTQFSSNVGFNLGAIASANRISGYGQNAANFGMQANNAMFTANTWGQIGSVSQSIFSAAGGFNAFKSAPTPAVAQPQEWKYSGGAGPSW